MARRPGSFALNAAVRALYERRRQAADRRCPATTPPSASVTATSSRKRSRGARSTIARPLLRRTILRPLTRTTTAATFVPRRNVIRSRPAGATATQRAHPHNLGEAKAPLALGARRRYLDEGSRRRRLRGDEREAQRARAPADGQQRGRRRDRRDAVVGRARLTTSTSREPAARRGRAAGSESRSSIGAPGVDGRARARRRAGSGGPPGPSRSAAPPAVVGVEVRAHVTRGRDGRDGEVELRAARRSAAARRRRPQRERGAGRQRASASSGAAGGDSVAGWMCTGSGSSGCVALPSSGVVAQCAVRAEPERAGRAGRRPCGLGAPLPARVLDLDGRPGVDVRRPSASGRTSAAGFGPVLALAPRSPGRGSRAPTAEPHLQRHAALAQALDPRELVVRRDVEVLEALRQEDAAAVVAARSGRCSAARPSSRTGRPRR